MFLLTTFRGRGREEPRGVEFKLLPQKRRELVFRINSQEADPGGWKAVLQNTWVAARPPAAHGSCCFSFLSVVCLNHLPCWQSGEWRQKLSHAQQ